MKIRVWFSDFWPGFDPIDNYFVELLTELFDLEITENQPDIIIFSCFGYSYKKYKALRIYFCGENRRPDFNVCDIALTFDYLDDRRHYRLPLYALYLDWNSSLETILDDQWTDFEDWTKRPKFCAMIVSNPASSERIRFFHELSDFQPVDSGGRYLNNVGGPVEDKIEFLKDYRFTIAFENSSHPGYNTEKLLEAELAGCIPIYWGDPHIGKEFNVKRFIEYRQEESSREVIDRILSIQRNAEIARQMLGEPIFTNNRIPDSIKKERVKAFLHEAIEEGFRNPSRLVMNHPMRHVWPLQKKLSRVRYRLHQLISARIK